jgi:hypothetical protein
MGASRPAQKQLEGRQRLRPVVEFGLDDKDVFYPCHQCHQWLESYVPIEKRGEYELV